MSTNIPMNRLLRVLSLYERLHKGETLVKRKESERFSVCHRTIQRDLDDIRSYLAEHHSHGQSHLIYERKKGGYVIKGSGRSWLTNAEILILSKVLLESRSCQKEEMETLLEKMILQAAPADREHIKEMLLNEMHHYVPVKHNKPLIQTLWQLSKAIKEKRLLEMEYRGVAKEPNEHLVKPVGLIFSEYYFYLLAYLTQYDYQYPTVYRVDRILSYKITDKQFQVPYLERFQEGEFRKRVQFMYAGDLMRVHLIYRGDHLEALLDRLPTAMIIAKDNKKIHLKAEVYGLGIKMWILSQGATLEVVKPDNFRQLMKDSIEEMASLYKDP